MASIISTVFLIRVKVFNPKKSIFRSPALSTTELSNCVTYIFESLAVAIGIKFVISSGVIIKPQACTPILRMEPSIFCACWMVIASKSSPSAIFLISFIFNCSSFRKAFIFSLFFLVSLKIVSNLTSGSNLAIRSVL